MSFYSGSDDNSDYGGFEPQVSSTRRSLRQRPQKKYTEIDSDSEDEIAGEETSELETWQVFLNPPIDQILGFSNEKYLVKYKDRSYIHLKWLTEEEIISEGRNGKLKLNRFLRERMNRLPEEEGKFFDPAFTDVDRVLLTTEIFPVVHPRQAALVTERWQGKCAGILSKIMNFRRNEFCYAIPFLYPIEQSVNGGTEYYKKVRYPVDFVTIHNRLYNGYYTLPMEFWKDLGFVFKNCQLFNQDREADIRIIGDTLRQLSVHLYKLWHGSTTDAGRYTLKWVSLVPNYDVTSPEFLQVDLEAEEFTQQDEEEDFNLNEQHLSQEELAQIQLEGETDKLFLVKWKNLSYKDSTWEPESLINNAAKISDYYRFNRALDTQARQEMTDLNTNFTKVMGYLAADEANKRYRGYGNSQLIHLLDSIDFPTFDSRTQIQQFIMSPGFKDGKHLREYQVFGLNWLLRNWSVKRNSILADEMGLGKTVQIVSFINTLVNSYKLRGPYLAIAPLSTLAHWKKTVEDWTMLNCVVYHDPNGSEGREFCNKYENYYIDIMKRGGVSEKSKLVKFHIMVTSYEVFMQDYNKFFVDIPWQLIAIDEAHRLKNKQAKILSFLRELPCRRFVLMTGTPLQNNTEELWSLLNFIQPQDFADLSNFLSKYGNLETKEQVEQLQENIKPYLLRRLKEEVEKSIPPLQETIIDVELTNIQKTYYRAIYERNRSFLCRGTLTPQLTNMEIQLRKCCNHPYLIKGVEQSHAAGLISDDEKMKRMIESSGKMVLLDKLLPRLKDQGKKVLIFSQFTQMLNLIEEYLRMKFYKFERLDGSVKATDRQASIERFNTEEQNIDIFLLSTRAGGLGINLTSAQVVIIFDSDWNPQNDVQATARAHRIGQKQEVQVYRLITARTYEAEMFERASRKLGLDQAVFARDNKAEIENLLKFGAYSIYEEDSGRSQQFIESNIDQILQTNTRIVDYNLIKNSYSFSKSSFVSHGSDTSINIDDPNFWNKVLPPQTSLSSRLLTKLNDRSFTVESQGEEFMQELELAVNEVMASKTNIETHNIEEEEILTSLLFQVTQTKQFAKGTRQLALQWMNELTRPLRNRSSRNKPDSPQIMSESEDESGEEKNRKKITSFGGTGIICAHCEKEGCGWICAGPCKRGYHDQCKDKELDLNHDSNLPEDEEDNIAERLGWKCHDCTKNKAACFVCGKKGPFAGHQKEGKNYEIVVKCSLNNCGKFFHLSCLATKHKKRFICPWHYCGICKASGNSKSLLQCSRCPNAFHLRCYTRKIVRLNKRYIVCHQHKQPQRPPIYPSHKAQHKENVKALKEKLSELWNKYSHLSITEEEKKAGEPRKKKKVASEEQANEIYQKYGLCLPEDFDYKNCRDEWCRFCGARKSASFGPGPWGKKMLCMAHASAWKSKKTLNLSSYKDVPEVPIDLSKNTELNYLLRL